jgi:hypothetical protein
MPTPVLAANSFTARLNIAPLSVGSMRNPRRCTKSSIPRLEASTTPSSGAATRHLRVNRFHQPTPDAAPLPVVIDDQHEFPARTCVSPAARDSYDPRCACAGGGRDERELPRRIRGDALPSKRRRGLLGSGSTTLVPGRRGEPLHELDPGDFVAGGDRPDQDLPAVPVRHVSPPVGIAGSALELAVYDPTGGVVAARVDREPEPAAELEHPGVGCEHVTFHALEAVRLGLAHERAH